MMLWSAYKELIGAIKYVSYNRGSLQTYKELVPW